MTRLTNISNNLIVCDIKDIETPTLTLKVGDSVTLRDEQVTPYIENLIKKGFLKKKVTPDYSITKVNKEKEE